MSFQAALVIGRKGSLILRLIFQKTLFENENLKDCFNDRAVFESLLWPFFEFHFNLRGGGEERRTAFAENRPSGHIFASNKL